MNVEHIYLTEKDRQAAIKRANRGKIVNDILLGLSSLTVGVGLGNIGLHMIFGMLGGLQPQEVLIPGGGLLAATLSIAGAVKNVERAEYFENRQITTVSEFDTKRVLGGEVVTVPGLYKNSLNKRISRFLRQG